MGLVDQIHAFREEEDEQLRKKAEKIAKRQMRKHVREEWRNTELADSNFLSQTPMEWMKDQAQAIYNEKRKEAILTLESDLREEASVQHNAAVAEIVRILEGFESVASDMIKLAKRDRRCTSCSTATCSP